MEIKDKTDSKVKNNVFLRFSHWLFSNHDSNLLKISIAVIPSCIAFIGSIFVTNKTLSSFKQEITQKIENNNIQEQNCNLNTTAQTNTPISKNVSVGDSKSPNGFIKDNWIFYKEISLNEDGYFCPGAPGFPNWEMWTKNKYNAERETNIVFSMLDKTNNNKKPTLMFSLGDKTNKKPDTYYTINIFDGDSNTLRLYNRKGIEIMFDRSKDDIPLNNNDYITFTVAPVFSSNKSASLLINPTVSYLIDGQTNTYTPKKEFRIELPLSKENQGDGFQIGLGVSKGDCFKVISSNL
jgi:hypothetical protein